MRIERVVEVVMPLVGLGIGIDRRAQQRKPQHIPYRVVPILRVIDHAQPMLSVAQISPAHCRNLKLRLLPRVIPRSSPFDGPIRNLISSKWSRSRQRKRRLQQHMLLMPIDVVLDIDVVRLVWNGDGLHKLRVLPVVCNAYGFRAEEGLDHLDGIRLGNRSWRRIQRAWVYVPSVVVFRQVFEELKLVAASSTCYRFRFCRLLKEAHDASGRLVYGHMHTAGVERD